jgi:hypothetical protein
MSQAALLSTSRNDFRGGLIDPRRKSAVACAALTGLLKR